MPRKPVLKNCPKCGRIFDALGLPNHRANCKREKPVVKAPRTDVWPFPASESNNNFAAQRSGTDGVEGAR